MFSLKNLACKGLMNVWTLSSVQTRLSSPEGMSLTEFTYQIFQSYDWLYLFKKYNCSIQVSIKDH